jgi:hypothetical protein
MERFKEHLVHVKGKLSISVIGPHIWEEDKHQKQVEHLKWKLILENRKELNIWESIFIEKSNKNPNQTLLNRDEGPSASILTGLTLNHDPGENHQFTHVKI